MQGGAGDFTSIAQKLCTAAAAADYMIKICAHIAYAAMTPWRGKLNCP
jgi:hypothetical protein